MRSTDEPYDRVVDEEVDRARLLTHLSVWHHCYRTPIESMESLQREHVRRHQYVHGTEPRLLYPHSVEQIHTSELHAAQTPPTVKAMDMIASVHKQLIVVNTFTSDVQLLRSRGVNLLLIRALVEMGAPVGGVTVHQIADLVRYPKRLRFAKIRMFLGTKRWREYDKACMKADAQVTALNLAWKAVSS